MNPNEIDSLKLLLDEGATEGSRELEDNAAAGVRRHFRVDSEQCAAEIKVEIEGRSYESINLSAAGIGVRVRDPKEFPYRNNLLPLILAIGKKTLRLQGRVIHVSSHESGDYIGGIDFCDMPAEAAKMIAKLLAKSRHR